MILLTKEAASRAGFVYAAFLGVWLVGGVAFAISASRSLRSFLNNPYEGKHNRVLSYRTTGLLIAMYCVVTTSTLIARGDTELNHIKHIVALGTVYYACQAFVGGILSQRTAKWIRDILVTLRLSQVDSTKASVERPKEGA